MRGCWEAGRSACEAASSRSCGHAEWREGRQASMLGGEVPRLQAGGHSFMRACQHRYIERCEFDTERSFRRGEGGCTQSRPKGSLSLIASMRACKHASTLSGYGREFEVMEQAAGLPPWGRTLAPLRPPSGRSEKVRELIGRRRGHISPPGSGSSVYRVMPWRTFHHLCLAKTASASR